MTDVEEASATAGQCHLSQLSAIYSYSFKKLSLCLHSADAATAAAGSDDEQADDARCLRVAQPNLVYVESADGRLRSLVLNGLRLEPITCSGLRRQGTDSVELSVSAAAEDDTDACVDGGDGDADVDDAVRIAALIRDARRLLCGFCRARLADLTRFADVKTTPSSAAAEGIHEAAAAYFCHVDHAEERKLVSDSRAAPAPQLPPDECHYDGVDLILPASVLVAGAMERGGRSLALCARCRGPVGFAAAGSGGVRAATYAAPAAFFPGLVSVLCDLRDADGDIVGEEATPLGGDDADDGGGRHLRRLLRRLGEGDAVRRVSLLAVSDTGAREVALLWRLDGRCRVFSADIGTDAADPDAVVCRGRRACRLLYLPFTDSAFSGVLAQWSRDVSVGSVCLPEELAMRSLLLLADSTGQLAPSFRRVHGFHCGFVPYDE